jgi:hypothetical protein
MLGLFKLKLTNFRIKMGFTLDSFSSNSERWKNAISRRSTTFIRFRIWPFFSYISG